MSDTPPRLNLIQRAMQHAQNRAAENPPPPVFLEEQSNPLQNSSAALLVNSPTVMKEPNERATRTPSLATVKMNYTRLRESKISLPGDRNSVTFNEFRSVKRKLLPLAIRNGVEPRARNIVMVSSALPAEGKTFTSMNLAIALAAEKNLNVILIDGDVIRSSVARYFSGQTGRGLLDLFSDSTCKLDDVLHRCEDVPNLHILFSGTQNDAAPEMFASARMAEICDLLSKRFPQSIVVIDSPPVLATSEPTSLATHIDHLIMVVAAGRSSRHQVETALSALTSCRSIFMLFNKAPRWQRPSQGSYYYYGAPSP